MALEDAYLGAMRISVGMDRHCGPPTPASDDEMRTGLSKPRAVFQVFQGKLPVQHFGMCSDTQGST